MRTAPRCFLLPIALAAVCSVVGAPVRAGSSGWLAVTEAGVTYQSEASPLESSRMPTHWHWTGVGGAVRTIGPWDAIGPVLIGSWSKSDYMFGFGLRWEHSVSDDWTVTATPGIAAHDLVRTSTELRPGYFGEIGVSFKRLVTAAVRQDAIRYEQRRVFYWGVETPTLTGHVWRYDLRLAGPPGAWALGIAAFALLVAGVETSTDAY
jgi:hypothetical protein